MGRPKTVWSGREKAFLDHAKDANVTEDLLINVDDLLLKVGKAAHHYSNPVIRLTATDALLHMEDELREARQDAIQELIQMGWGWTKIGRLLGISRQRAWQIGNGR